MKKFCFAVFSLSFLSMNVGNAQHFPAKQSLEVQNVGQPNPRPDKDTSGVVAVQPIWLPKNQTPVSLRNFVFPATLFAYGALTITSGSLHVFNEEVNKALSHGGKYSGLLVENYLLFVPAAAVYGLNIFGVPGRNNLLDRSVIYGMSNLIANGLVYGVKQFGIETRPDSSDKHSFPSGHTSEAFVSAEFLHQEYRGKLHWSVIAGGYAVAIGVGYLRMYHNKHWLSDVVAGAGIGIAATRFSYFLYPTVKHLLFGSRTVRNDAMIMPTYQNGGGYGLAFSYLF